MTAHLHDPVDMQPPATTQECISNACLDLFGNQVAARFGRHIVAAAKVLADSTLPARLPDPDSQHRGRTAFRADSAADLA